MGDYTWVSPDAPRRERWRVRVRNALLLSFPVSVAIPLAEEWTPRPTQPGSGIPRRFRLAYRRRDMDAVVWAIAGLHWVLRLWNWWQAARWAWERAMIRSGHMALKHPAGFYREAQFPEFATPDEGFGLYPGTRWWTERWYPERMRHGGLET